MKTEISAVINVKQEGGWWEERQMIVTLEDDEPTEFLYWSGDDRVCFSMNMEDLEKLLKTIKAIKSIQ